MKRRLRQTSWHRRRGAVAAHALVSSAVILGMGALAVDVGMLYTAQTELQVAADASALAAAAQLAASGDVRTAAIQAADEYAQKNRVLGMTAAVYPEDVEFGRAVPSGSGGRFRFEPAVERFDALRLTLRHVKAQVPGERSLLSVPLTFAQVFGSNHRNLQARAVAVLVPRDIAVVIDLSGSMNDDSELRHYKRYQGEGGEWRNGIQINLRDVWCALNGPAPRRPYVPGAEDQTEYAGDSGPTVGAMTVWGNPVVPETYNPATDPGLWHIPQSANCTVAAAQSSLQARGYTSDEISCLLTGSRDGQLTNQWRNRTAVILNLATWRSGRAGGTAGGNGDALVQDNELTWAAYPAYRSSSSAWTWADYISYVASSSTKMAGVNSAFRYRFGLKTFVNFLLESRPRYNQTNILWQTPEQPLQAVKDAVQHMTDTIVALESLDRLSLEIFAQTAQHEVDLTDNLQTVPGRLYAMQAGHYDTYTNMAGGLQKGVDELSSARARATSAKVIVLMSDGKPNVDRNGNYVGEGAASAVAWVREVARQAAALNMRIYTVSVGGDSDPQLMAEIASIGRGQHFHAEGRPDEYSQQLEEIFRTLGGKRPVQLIE